MENTQPVEDTRLVDDAPIGTPDRPLRVAVVGAGPSGFYAAAALLDAPGLTVSVDVLDRLPAPYGLVRYGVAPDHQKIKNVSRVFDKTARDPRVRFLGNVCFGPDLAREDLLALYDRVIYAVGAQTDRRLGIPGEDLPGSWSSTELVAWYNGHPDFMAGDFPLHHEAVAIVGIGNVAIDCARILAKSADELAATDISDEALAVLRESRVRDVWVLARRGPLQAACTPQELKELGEIPGVAVLVEPDEVADPAAEGEPDRQAQKNLELFRAFAADADKAAAAERRIHFRFLVSPVEVLAADGGIAGLRLERNRLVPKGECLSARGTGEHEVLPVSAVIRAIGYRSVPLPGVPFDERGGVIPNREGRVFDPESGEVRAREYVVGWAKRGPSGLIGTNKGDSAATIDALVADLAAAPAGGAAEPSRRAVLDRLDERGVRWVSFEDWCALDELETSRGAASGRPRIKLCRVEEMLEALAGRAENAEVVEAE
ncbi:MAG TPA: FAD-dependent oxidoreductase [Thermoanaerobaculia bacterium]|nr:FAD-dependent oxidoreductase [Thermoanaerobaculia bacterium]